MFRRWCEDGEHRDVDRLMLDVKPAERSATPATGIADATTWPTAEPPSPKLAHPRRRRDRIACLVVATAAALLATHSVSLAPLKIAPRATSMATASTQVLVDTPRSSILDLRQDLFDMTSLANRSLLIGNVMASPPVLAYIGRRAGVSGESIRVVTPRTPNSPRPLLPPGRQAGSRDLLRSGVEHRLSIEADPTVPVLRIYAQAPTPQGAAALANASVEGLGDYLAQVGRIENVAWEDQVRLHQLGRAEGTVINSGFPRDVAGLVFVTAFATTAGALALLRRRRSA